MIGGHKYLYIKPLLFLHLGADRIDWDGFRTPQKSENVIIMASDGFFFIGYKAFLTIIVPLVIATAQTRG